MSRLTPLLLPFALAPDGRVVHAGVADRGLEYRCAGCDGQLTLHRGDKLRAHFAHASGSTCSLESAEHQAAKRLVMMALEENRRATVSRLTLEMKCAWCKDSFGLQLPPRSVDRAEMERRVGDFVGDVVGLRGEGADERVALVIEVFHTNPVSPDKAARLGHPWLELRTADVLGDFSRNPAGPFTWRPWAHGGLKLVRCPDCRNWEKKVHATAATYGLPCSGVARPSEIGKGAYLAALETCWSCKEDVPVYWWAGAPFAVKQPPEPRPRTIRFRPSKSYGGSYWMNCCAKCNAPLGDNYLYMMGGMPLGEMPQRNISAEVPTETATQAFMRRLSF